MGSGTSVQEINKLLRQCKQMQIIIKRVKKWATSSSWGAACRRVCLPAYCRASSQGSSSIETTWLPAAFRPWPSDVQTGRDTGPSQARLLRALVAASGHSADEAMR
jgi:hypothetical protein